MQSPQDRPHHLSLIRENLAADSTTPSIHEQPIRPCRRPLMHSHASHVQVDFFDPAGVHELERTLTRMTSRRSSTVQESAPSKESSSDSDISANQQAEFDFEKIMKAVVQRRDEADVQTRYLGVSFENLSVVGLGAGASYQETLGSTLNPLNHLESFRTRRHGGPPLRDILTGFEGVVRPGEMLLVLGSPGSGCSTLLKTLANQRADYHSVTGEVHYDSLTPEDVEKHYRGDVQYCPEDDVHFPTLTVEQTLRFAAKTRAPANRTVDRREEYVDKMVEILMTIFGLRHARNTPVGDASVRGVSGGEKKRVSISEMLATRSRIGAWDNSTRGLDASTALEFGQALRIATDIDKVATIVSIYQAGEKLYSLFDKVAVIYEGRMAYFGPTDQAKDHFIDMGYQPANRQTTPDFLVACTNALGRTLREGADPAGPTPRSAEEFAEYFNKSLLGAQNREDIDAYKQQFVGLPDRKQHFKKSAHAEHAEHTRRSSPYTISLPMQARAVMLRRVQILLGNPTATLFNLMSFIIQGIIIGTVFLKVPEATSAYFSRGGVLFFALLFSALSSMAEIPTLYAQRPIISRHQKAAMYHPFVEAVALTVVDIPISFMTTIVFAIILYFLVGLQRTASQFFIFYLFLFAMTLTMKAWFRSIAAGFKKEATAQSFAGIVLLGLVLYIGYTIPKPSMIGALSWITYINPIRYGFESLMANEFHTLRGSCSSLVPQGAGYEGVTLDNQVCATVGAVPGQSYVDGNNFLALSYDYYYRNLWMNFGIVIAFAAGFIVLLFVFTEYLTGEGHETSRVLFLRGTKKGKSNASVVGADEEKTSRPLNPSTNSFDQKEMKKALDQQPPMTNVFSWQHIQYTVPVSGGERRLLDDVSGYVAPGKLTALMGSSGAGKTTLLNVLAERVSTGVVHGEKFVNGQALPRDFQAQTGYCQQMDTHVPTDSVREALLMSARLRQPGSVPLAEKEAYVDICLKMCGLEPYADAAVGSLSVEHRKRTTIGVELAAKPKLLLFLDEPTSGLDSQSAWAIMQFLRSLADHGQAILCTIHQPSAELFQVFDRLLLLRKGGQTVYFGDLGKNAEILMNYFERNGARHCEVRENPAEYMLEAIGAGATATSIQDWHDVWKRAPESMTIQDEIEKIHAEGRSRPPVAATLHNEFATSWGNQFRLLLKRDLLFRYRDPAYLMAKLVLNITGGLFIGFTFFDASSSQQGTQNKLFAIFMSLIISVPVANQLQVPWLNMRNIYEIRERPSRMYHWSALLTAQFLAEIPWNLVGSCLLFFCWYWTVGFPTARAGYTFLMLVVLCPFYYTSFAQAVAAMTPNAEIAALAFSLLFSFVLNFNGVIQPYRQLGWWQWMYHLSPYTYLIEGLLGQAIGGQAITCSDIELVSLNPPSGQTCGEYMESYISSSGGYLTNSDATSDCLFCSTSTTDQFLAGNFNILYSHRWRNVGIFCAFIVFNTVMIYVFTYFIRVRTGSFFGNLKNRFFRSKDRKETSA